MASSPSKSHSIVAIPSIPCDGRKIPLPLNFYIATYLHSEVELTDEREQHITQRHPDLLPEHRERIVETLASPDQVRRSRRFSNARLFSRWFDAVRGGKYVIVIVVSDPAPSNRHWIITAYLARRVEEGVIEWTRN